MAEHHDFAFSGAWLWLSSTSQPKTRIVIK
jgi:hypothetical protein